MSLRFLSVFLIWGVLGQGVWAHEPLASWTEAKMSSEGLSLVVVLTPGEARMLVTDDVDDAPHIYPGQFDKIKPLFMQYAIFDLYDLEVDGEPLNLDRANVVYDVEQDDVIFELYYPQPFGKTLTFRAKYLDLMPEEHEATLIAFDAAGESLGWDILIKGNDRFVAELGTQQSLSGWASFKRFFVLGVEHILIGYDHLLFLAGLILVCQRFSEMAIIISCFTVAHSLTLALAALNFIVLPGNVVEPLIAASIVYVGVENLLRVPQKRWVLTLCFGLIHGFGFAGVLRETGLGTEGWNLVVPLFSFNLGVEVGQIAVASVVLPVILTVRKWSGFVRYALPVLSGMVTVMGGYWFVTRVFFS